MITAKFGAGERKILFIGLLPEQIAWLLRGDPVSVAGPAVGLDEKIKLVLCYAGDHEALAALLERQLGVKMPRDEAGKLVGVGS